MSVLDFNNKLESIQKDEFTKMVEESKTLATIGEKEALRISKNPVVIQRIVQLYVTGSYTNSQIASMMGVGKRTIDRILKKEEVLDMIVNYQKEEKEYIDARLKALRNKSLDTLFELLDSEEDTVRLNASKDILDRTGHNVKKDSNININVSYEQQLQELSSGVDLSYVNADYVVNEEE